jgi:hypothetical protein
MVAQGRAMRSLDEVMRGELRWLPTPDRNWSFELLAGEETVGMLCFQHSMWRRPATADFADNHWTFSTSPWRSRVTVRAPGSETALALFRPSLFGRGTLDLTPVRRVYWKRMRGHSEWQETDGRRLPVVGTRRQFRCWNWEWQESDGRPLLHFTGREHANDKWFNLEGTVTVDPAAAPGEVPLLAALGWYKALNQRRSQWVAEHIPPSTNVVVNR